MTLGRALFDTGDMAAARAEFEAVLKGAPDNILASRLLAECLEGLGDLAAAARQYKTTLALAPGDKQVQGHLDAVDKKLKAGPAAPPPASSIAPTIVMPSPAPRAPRAPAAPRPAGGFEPSADTSPDRYPRPEPEPPSAPPPLPPDRDFAPIPLVAADETFELEAAHESTPTKVGGGSASAAGGDWVVGIATPMPTPQPEPASALAPEHTFPMPRPTYPTPEPVFPMPEEPPTVEEPPPAPDFSEEFTPPTPEPPRLPPLPMEPPAPAPEPVAVLEPTLIAEPAAPPAPSVALEPAVEPETPPPPPPSAPPVVAAAPPAERARAEPAPAEADLSSSTLAELYFNQGFTDKALAVYRQLLQREPGNERARARVAEIEGLERRLREEEARAPAAEPAGARDPGAARRQAIERTIARLEGLLAAVKKGEE
jgi:tetratricopeptide (TPR) repeat protein